MHMLQAILMTGLGHILSLLKHGVELYDFLRHRFGRVARAKERLQSVCMMQAYKAATASTMRGGRILLRTPVEWRAAFELQSEGRGYVREGCYEVWVNTMPSLLRGA
jgi:hypothetical protein